VAGEVDVIEKHADLWTLGELADACCITTNGTITGKGLGVMGRGNALEACDRYNVPRRTRTPAFSLQRKLGIYLQTKGNHTGVLLPPPPLTLVVLPVKHQWMEQADLELIDRSLRELAALADRMGWKQIVLPRPGVGNGGLDWITDGVCACCQEALDDRFTVVWK